MPADYNIIQGPHVSEGLLEQRANAYGALGRGLGDIAETIAQKEKERKAYNKFTGLEAQKLKDLAQEAQQADYKEILGHGTEGAKELSNYLKTVPRKEWYGPETIARIGDIRNNILQKVKASNAYHTAYESALNSKEPDVNRNAINQHYLEELKKPLEEREAINLANPKFRNVNATVSEFLHNNAAKDLVHHGYTTRDNNYNYLKEKVFNPAYYNLGENGKVQKNDLRFLAEKLVQEKPYVAQHIMEMNPDLQEHYKAGEHQLVNELALQRVQDQLFNPLLSTHYAPQDIIKSQDELSREPKGPGEAKLAEENRLAEERVKNIKTLGSQIKAGNFSGLDALNEIGKTKGFNVAAEPKSGIVKFTYEVPVKKTLEDGTKVDDVETKTAAYHYNRPDQYKAFLMHLSDRIGEVYGTKVNQDIVANKLAEETKKEEPKKEKVTLKQNYRHNGKEYSLAQLKEMGYTEDQIMEAAKNGKLE